MPADRTADGRPGVVVQIWHRSRKELKPQMVTRIGQCILTCPTSAVDAMGTVEGVVLSPPGGICRSGPKVGSMKYKLPASTNHPFCPLLRSTLSDSKVLSTVQSVYELVFNGIDTDTFKKAMGIDVAPAAKVPGVAKITAVDSGGKLGPHRISLVESLKLVS